MQALHFAFLLALASLFNSALAATPGEIAVGGTLRDASMQSLTGQNRQLSNFIGKPLIINVWASWCGPCRAEMPSLERLNQHKGGLAFEMIGVSTDDYPDAAKGFLKKTKTTFSHFIDQRLLLENMLGADRLPLTILVDSKGRVLARFYGAKAWDTPEARALIDKAFR